MDRRRFAGTFKAASATHPANTGLRLLIAEPVTRKAASKYVYVDLARGIAALLVLAGHLRAFVFTNLFTVDHVSIVWKSFYLITSIGPQSVMVFFVLSGFLITKNISQSAQSGRWSWPIYAMKRLSRLWIVLLPALALTFFWDRLGMTLTHSPLYTGAMEGVFHSVPMTTLSYTPLTAVGNVFFLQTILVPAFGSNGPLWSLANEFWYYLLFPLAFFALRRETQRTVRFALAVAAIALAVWLPRPLIIFGLVWLLGYVAFLIEPQMRRLSTALHLALVGVGLTSVVAWIVVNKSGRLHDTPADFLIGISFTLALVAMTQLRAPRWVESGATFLSEFSYSLYLVHFPFLAFLFSLIFHNAQFRPGLHGALIFAGAFLVACAYGFAVYWLFERHTATVQAHLSRLILKKERLGAN